MTKINISVSQTGQNAVLHTMLAGTFLSRAGYFMTWPYLSVVLYRQFELSASLIGVIFFMTSASGLLIGVFGSYYSDRLGRERALVASLLLSVAGFAMMAYSNHPVEFVIAMTFIATGRACTESFSKAMIGDHVKDIRQRERFQYIRYYIVNIGTALGPLAGTYALATPKVNIFIFSSVTYLVYAIILMGIIGVFPVEKNNDRKLTPDITSSLHIVFSQKSFSKLLMCYFLVMFIYVSFDSPLIQLLTRLHFPDLTLTINTIFMTNAVTVLVCQYPVLLILRKFNAKGKIIIGILFISTAQLCFMMAYFDILALIVIATFILSIGELITMPAFSVEVDRLAPENLRGTSFGLINLTSLGTSLCPLFCGFFIDAEWGYAMFLFLFFTGLISIFLYCSVAERTSDRQI